MSLSWLLVLSACGALATRPEKISEHISFQAESQPRLHISAPMPPLRWEGSWIPALVVFVGTVVVIPILCHMFPGPMKPGSLQMLLVNGVSSAVVALLAVGLVNSGADPFYYGILYSGALMLLCVEVWFSEAPQLFNGSVLKGWPFFLFHQPGAEETKAPVPMSGYTRVFGSWHAGGVCLCFFMHVLGLGFPEAQKAQVALALGLLWVIWASSNSWRAIYGAAQFCQTGIMFHGLTGSGCGLCGYLMLIWWHQHRGEGAFAGSEVTLLVTFGIYVFLTLAWLATQERTEAVSDK